MPGMPGMPGMGGGMPAGQPGAAPRRQRPYKKKKGFGQL
jgi:signal recognition particle subunit SRP54